MKRIDSITFTHPPGMPGLRAATVNTIRPDQSSGPWVGWEFAVVGDRLHMIAPVGIVPGRDVKAPGQRYVYDVPLAIAAITWVEDVGGTTGVEDPLDGDIQVGSEREARALAVTTISVDGVQVASRSEMVELPVERDEPVDEPVVEAKRPDAMRRRGGGR